MKAAKILVRRPTAPIESTCFRIQRSSQLNGTEGAKFNIILLYFSQPICVTLTWVSENIRFNFGSCAMALHTLNEDLNQVSMLSFLRHSTNMNRVFFIKKQFNHKVLGDTIYTWFYSMYALANDDSKQTAIPFHTHNLSL
jgi:hypothetical protein